MQRGALCFTLIVMPREVDPKRTRKALRIVRKLKELAAKEEIDPETGEVKPREGGADYSQWEEEFLSEVDTRLEKYGSAFHNLQKAAPKRRCLICKRRS